MVDRLPIAIRAYTERPTQKAPGEPRGNDKPSDWALVFDCETTTDASQRLRIGAYQVRRADNLKESGLFYDAEALSASELDLLKSYAAARDLRCIDRVEFTDRVFLRYGYVRRATVIGFNLPFDLSRIAIDHGEARGSMRGGFTFTLSRWKSEPHVRVKKLSRRSALIDFAIPGKQATSRGSRGRGIKTRAHRGFFVDVGTLTFLALHGEPQRRGEAVVALNQAAEGFTELSNTGALTQVEQLRRALLETP